MKKRAIAALTAATMSLGLLAGCGGGSSTETSASAAGSEAAEATAGGTLNLGMQFWYEMDAHTDYNGWYTSMYGITETLFKVAEDYSLESGLAKEGTLEGNTWTITLNDAVFSNGNPVTADIVVKNLQRIGEVNVRGAEMATSTFEVVDDKTFKITTAEPAPTLLQDLAEPMYSIMDIDSVADGDYNNGVIGTGPFAVDTYSHEDEIHLVKNENYWDGDVMLDEVNVYYIPDTSTEATSLQSGEIDMYVGPDVDSIALFSADSNYTVTSVPSTRSYFYEFNMDTVSDINVRKAVMQAVNKSDIEALLAGTFTASDAPYGADTALGALDAPAYDVEAAKKTLEDAGYALNANGFYEKDGKEVNLRVAYFAGRSVDKITTLIQDQLKTAGINTTLELYEVPESTYMDTGDFDMAMYVYSNTTTGDAYHFVYNMYAADGFANAGHYVNEEAQSLLKEYAVEADADKRTEYAVNIMQKGIDDAAYGYYGISSKTTVKKASVSNVSENHPLQIYILNKDSAIAK